MQLQETITVYSVNQTKLYTYIHTRKNAEFLNVITVVRAVL
jgi:hypothetical protein